MIVDDHDLHRWEDEGGRPHPMGDEIETQPVVPFERRRKVLVLSDWALTTLLGAGKHSYEVVKDAIPPDATIINVRFNAFCGSQLEVLIESSEFEPVRDGEQYPIFAPQLREIRS